MASAKDVPIVKTPKGVRVSLGKLYMYPDGLVKLTFPPVPEAGSRSSTCRSRTALTSSMNS